VDAGVDSLLQEGYHSSAEKIAIAIAAMAIETRLYDISGTEIDLEAEYQQIFSHLSAMTS